MCVLLHKEQQMWIESPPKTKYTYKALYVFVCKRDKENSSSYICAKRKHTFLSENHPKNETKNYGTS